MPIRTDVNGVSWQVDANGEHIPGTPPVSNPSMGPRTVVGSITTGVADPYARRSVQAQATVDEGHAATTPDEIEAKRIETKQKTLDYNNAVRDSQPLGDMTKNGQEYLATIAPRSRHLVEMVGTNQVVIGSMGLRNAQMQQIMNAAKQAYPKFDPTLAPVRQKAIFDYSGGGDQSTAMQAADRAVGTMRMMKDASDNMGGPNVGYEPANRIIAGQQQDVGKRRIVDTSGFNALMPDLMGQLSTVLGAKGASAVSDRQEVKQGFRPGASQDERNQAFKVISGAIMQSAAETRQGWNSAFRPGGGDLPPPVWFSPENARYLEDMAGAKRGTLAADVPHDLNTQNTHAFVSEFPRITPPGDNGSVPATGATKYDPTASAPIDKAIRSGMSYDQALKAGLFPSTSKPNPDERTHWNKLVAYAATPEGKAHKGSYADIEVPTNTWNRIMNTGPGIGAANFFNTATGGAPIAMSGDDARLGLDAGNAAHPYYAGAGQLGGFIAGSIGAGKLLRGMGFIKGAAAPVADGIEAMPGRLAQFGNFLRNASPTMVLGAANAASESPDHPYLAAAAGTASALGGEVVGHAVVAPVLRAAAETAPGQAALSWAARAAQGFGDARSSGQAIIPSSLNGLRQAASGQGAGFTPAPALDAGQQIIANTGALTSDNVGNIRGQLQDATDLNFPMTLADTDTRLRMAGGSAARLSPDVRALAENTLITRAKGRNGRAVQVINDHLAPTGNIADIQAANKLAAQQAGRPFFDAAMDAPPVSDPTITDLLNTPGGVTAAKQGYANALNKQVAPGDLSMSIDPITGQPRYDASLSWPTLQNIKMGMDSNLEPFRNPLTGKLKIDPGSPAEALDRLRGAYRAQLGALNPDYAAGNAAYAKVRGFGNATQQGYDLAGKMGTMNADEVGNIARSVSPEHLPAFQQGVASKLAEKTANTESDPYAFINGPDGAQQRLQAIFPEGASKVGTANRLEDQFGLTRTELTGGSQTAPRAAADKLFKMGIGGAALMDAALVHGGVPPIATAGALGLAGINKAVQDAGTRAAMRGAESVGPQLLNQNPLENLAAIDAIIKQNAARQAYISRFGAAGGAFGAPAASLPLLYGLSQ